MATFDTKIVVEKVYVVPGERRISFPGVAVLRELVDLGELDPDSALVVGSPQDANGGPLDEAEAMRRIEARGYVYFVRSRWQLRPGDVVQVELRGAGMLPGYYVPMNAVSRKLDESFVFVVDESTSPPSAAAWRSR